MEARVYYHFTQKMEIISHNHYTWEMDVIL